MKTVILAAIMFLTFAQIVVSQSKYDTYSNARFGYSVSYPADLLKPQGEAENGDGQIFAGDEAEMRVFGSNMLLNKTISKEFNQLVKEKGASVTYKLLRRKDFTISGKKDGKIFYQKTIEKSGAFITFMIEYDESKRGIFDKTVSRIAKSLR